MDIVCDTCGQRSVIMYLGISPGRDGQRRVICSACYKKEEQHAKEAARQAREASKQEGPQG